MDNVLNVGGGIAAIGGIGLGKGVKLGSALKSGHVWSWIIFFACLAWLFGLFAAFGGYKGDVAS
jgi:hypothetical protein